MITARRLNGSKFVSVYTVVSSVRSCYINILAMTNIILNEHTEFNPSIFLNKSILLEMTSYDDLKSTAIAVYLACDWSDKHGATDLGCSARDVTSLIEYLQYFKKSAINEYNMWVIAVRLDTSYDSQDTSDKDTVETPVKPKIRLRFNSKSKIKLERKDSDECVKKNKIFKQEKISDAHVQGMTRTCCCILLLTIYTKK